MSENPNRIGDEDIDEYPKIDVTGIKAWLREARLARGLSVDEAATRFKVCTSDILRWEHDSSLDVPTQAELESFSKKLKVLLPWHSWPDAARPTVEEPGHRQRIKPDFTLIKVGIELTDRASIKLWVRTARKSAKLTQRQLSDFLDVSAALITRWELNAFKDVPRNEMTTRIAEVCRVPAPTIPPDIRKFLKEQEANQAMPEIEEGADEENPYSSLLDEISAVASRLVNLTWDKERQTRNAEMFVHYYGRGRTLEETGELYSLTRERVRQLITRMVDNAARRKLPRSCFDLLVERSRKIEICSLEVAERLLADVLSNVRLEDAMLYGAHVLGQGFPLEIDHRGDLVMVIPRGQSNWTNIAISYARKMIRRNGAALVDLVWAHMARTTDASITRDSIISVLKGMSRFSWLGDGENWFWFGPADGSNRMIDWTRRILATAGRKVDIEQILAGVARDNRFEREESDVVVLLPPANVLHELLASCADIEAIQHDDLVLTTMVHVPSGEPMASGEVVLDLLRKNGGVMSKFAMQRTPEGKKINPVTLNVTLSRYPLISQLDHGIYAIRGARLAGDAIKRAYLRTSLTGLGKVGQKHVWNDDDGSVCWKVELTAGAIQNRQMGLPADARGLVEFGIYNVVDGGMIKLTDDGKNQFVRGAVKELLAQGGQEGDCFVVMVHPKLRTARFEPL